MVLAIMFFMERRRSDRAFYLERKAHMERELLKSRLEDKEYRLRQIQINSDDFYVIFDEVGNIDLLNKTFKDTLHRINPGNVNEKKPFFEILPTIWREELWSAMGKVQPGEKTKWNSHYQGRGTKINVSFELINLTNDSEVNGFVMRGMNIDENVPDGSYKGLEDDSFIKLSDHRRGVMGDSDPE